MKNAGVRGKKRKRDFCRGEGEILIQPAQTSCQITEHMRNILCTMYVLLIFMDKAWASLRCLKISFVPFSSSREGRLWEANEQEKMHKIHFQSLIKYFSSSFFVRFMKIQKLKCFVFIWIFYLPFFLHLCLLLSYLFYKRMKCAH